MRLEEGSWEADRSVHLDRGYQDKSAAKEWPCDSQKEHPQRLVEHRNPLTVCHGKTSVYCRVAGLPITGTLVLNVPHDLTWTSRIAAGRFQTWPSCSGYRRWPGTIAPASESSGLCSGPWWLRCVGARMSDVLPVGPVQAALTAQLTGV